MVKPTNFFLNEETFQDNKFMNPVQVSQLQSSQQAKDEYSRFRDKILDSGVDVSEYQQQSPELPDSVFPNNWFSTHRGEDFPDGLFILYPMKAPTREREKNPLVVQEIGGKYKDLIDIKRENPEQALEGTGSLLFDIKNKKIYCSLSVRADPQLLASFTKQFNTLSKTPY